MYLAPLNYDRYFKKAFSDLDTAKAFLEDFFDVEIESIETLSTAHKVTDDAVAVEFDFRCKIDGHYVIVDMQQWYKPDVIHRFYAYHCISTVLQLETLPIKSIMNHRGKERRERDYAGILPVITLVWMADDTLGCTEDRVSYTMTPEIVSEFIRNKLLWDSADIKAILEERERALGQLSNNTKRMGFLQENRLIYAFQKNIVANAAKAVIEGNTGNRPRYMRWFGLAEKSKQKDNTKADFAEYESDRVFDTLLRRLNRDGLTPEDYTYIDDFEEATARFKRWNDGFYNEGWEDGRYEGRREGRQDGWKEGRQDGWKEGVEKGMEKGIYETAQNAISEGFPNEVIKKITKLTDEQIDGIRKSLEGG